ncbi:hypothetical protein Agabi119p4_5936 [Agaricus bisporus var. burnettii]|uniref:Uncharacterized protein n=1 Tax=Agaricus bisporus var. burnettii TaxID=192524 RepID=A0A8H7F0V9_AGABI|nr:hypothetical protein Agabi119p4_5936 [Agaricus bisporus var. burnettii]
MSHPPQLTEYGSCPSEPTQSPDNDLFLERLDTFMQKVLNDIKAFAERESRPYEEMRRIVAEWHAKTLFTVDNGIGETRDTRVRNVLVEASKVLESLSSVTGIQSFLLAVDPHDPQDAGFLGGSIIGREYYRGLRGGGIAGASSFKTFLHKRLPTQQEEIDIRETSPHPTRTPAATRTAKKAKLELYESIRSQLRQVSGIRKAEMKWTNPERLGLFGVRMIGWPPDIPAANPSSLKLNQNQRLLELVEQGELRFEKTMMTGLETSAPPETLQGSSAAEDFSWAYDADGHGDASLAPTPETAAAVLTDASPIALDAIHVPMLSSSTDDVPEVEADTESTYSWKGHDEDLLAEIGEYGFQVETWGDGVQFEGLETESPVERRVRKRAREEDE